MATKTYEKTKYYFTSHRGLRYTVQFIMFLLLNGGLFGLTFIWLTLPINQPPTPWSISDGALYIFTQMSLSVVVPFIPIAMFLLVGTLVGKTFCGWVCPMGFFQDILALISPFKKHVPTKRTNENWSDLAKLFGLVFIFFSFFLGFAKLTSGKEGLFSISTSFGILGEDPLSLLDPASTLFAFIPYMIINDKVPGFGSDFDVLNFGPFDNLNWDVLFFWFRLFILLFVIIISMVIPRAFCRYMCPTGGILSYMSENALIGVNRNLALCNQCRACEDICPMGVRLLDHPERMRDSLCINCADCVHVCDTGALKIGLK